MNWIAVDTSGKNLTVIACKNSMAKIFNDPECGVRHSVSLMPAIEKTASDVGLDFSEVDFFCAVVGAGSFTGIRIGVSTVKALCFAYKKPCLAITSFDTMAYNKIGGKILAVIDAKHNGYYVCGYDGEKIVIPPAYLSGEELKSIKKGFKLVAGEAVSGFKCKEVSIAQGLYKAVESKLNLITDDLESLTPLYCRKSQAEEGR